MIRYWFVLWLAALTTPLHALQNELQNHPSPYLAMHGDDPVVWQDWNQSVLDQARAQDKLIFISSGYFSCHWCHVMQKESYQHPEIAKILNEFFIPVKIDRELHGALDAYLIDYLENTQGHAGWPLNIFMTPEGYPLIGATYLPPDRFKLLLRRLNDHWNDNRSHARNLARRALLELMNKQVAQEIEVMPPLVLINAFMKQALSVADTMEGGFGEQSRFPMTPQLTALLTMQSAYPKPALAEFLELTLDQMAAQGLRDHLGGGFYRYTVDPSWQTPHYEKMLYTQAQLAEVYLTAAIVLDRPDYQGIARETLDFVIREMTGAQGGMVSSFSAVDDKGEEGAYYLWQRDELEANLCERDLAIAERYWRLQEAINHPGALPRSGQRVDEIAQELSLQPDFVKSRIAKIKQKLLSLRNQRVLPVDNKELAGWNGLMLAAFSRAASEFGTADYAVTAQKIRDFLINTLWDGKTLHRAKANAQPVGKASLADYVYVAYGMAYYAQLSGRAEDLVAVKQLIQQAWQRFYGTGGWRLTDDALIPGMGAEPALKEGALPSPSALLLALSNQYADAELLDKTRQAIKLSRAKVQEAPFWYAGHTLQLFSLSQ